MNFEVTVLKYRFDDTLKKQLADKLPFEQEDSNFAPEPSVAVGIHDDGGREFGLIYLQHSKQLLVFGELDADRPSAAAVFRSAFPELDAFEVPARFKTEPYVE
jgi:hypothetical protein